MPASLATSLLRLPGIASTIGGSAVLRSRLGARSAAASRPPRSADDRHSCTAARQACDARRARTAAAPARGRHNALIAARPPRPPRPDRWRHVIDDRDRAVEPAHETRNPQRKGRAVDDDQRVRAASPARREPPAAMWLTIRGSRPGMAEKPMMAKSSIGNRLTRPGRGHFAAADAGEPQRFGWSVAAARASARRQAGRRILRQRPGKSPIRRTLVRTPGRLDVHRSVPSALTPMTKTLARSAAAAMRSGSATSVEPATTAKPAKPAPAAASTVGGPITGRSMRWS